MVHVVINNSAHESVGGMPTVAGKLDLVKIAEGCGYSYTKCVYDHEVLVHELVAAKERDIFSFIEVKCSLRSRKDLGRPTTTAKENKIGFMAGLFSSAPEVF